MSRTSKKTITDVTLEQAETAAALYANAITRLDSIEAKMNGEIEKVKAKYQDDIIANKDAIKEPFEILEQYAKQDKQNWRNKSIELLNVIIGFRTSTPSVAKTKFTWDAIIDLVKKNKYLKQFVRTKEELNKQAILECKDEKIMKRLQEDAYIIVEQKETFYVEPKKENITGK